MIKLTDILNESPQSDKLSREIDKSISKIDDSMSYVDFAHAVAKVLKNEYGSHLYDKFIKELKKKL
jgi:hypothetical protein